MRRDSQAALLAGGAVAAWVGAWGPWLAHPSAGLTQSALDMARVGQRLPQVLYGRLGSMPDLLRLSVGLMVVVLCLVASHLERRALRWFLRGMALIMAVRLLPPYPELLYLWRSPDGGRRFLIAALTLAGWGVALTGRRWSELARSLVVLAGALLALLAGLWADLALQRSFVEASRLAFSPGWGLALYVAGFLLVILLSLRSALALIRSSSSSA